MTIDTKSFDFLVIFHFYEFVVTFIVFTRVDLIVDEKEKHFPPFAKRRERKGSVEIG